MSRLLGVWLGLWLGVGCGQPTVEREEQTSRFSALRGAPARTRAAGASHSLTVRSDGSVWAVGDNTYGQLGNGNTTSRTVPVRVLIVNGVVDVAANYTHSLALGANGRVWAWGSNTSGQLGDGTTSNRTLPWAVQGVSGSGGRGHARHPLAGVALGWHGVGLGQ
ncbi:RCC1 domain-containing protein [Hyalangium rubrum]|uniref:RCC1 repeat-containing protein n=1 Tax=Hyalangium rubrum TaxID=3103134 RepID=A0ABU5HIC7_9BACT|nr:hypothetical protein [Hyalangium sp. s54d21]MDY7232912.1 hypothetical protein [Hyalangium sp. s54d21]